MTTPNLAINISTYMNLTKQKAYPDYSKFLNGRNIATECVA